MKNIKMWYLVKYVEYLLIAACILLLVLNSLVNTTVDNFTMAYPDKNDTKNKKPVALRQIMSSITLPPRMLQGKPQLTATTSPISTEKPEEKESDDKKGVNLSDMLILYPCGVAILIILTMEMLGQALQDPLKRGSNIFLVFLCVLLGIATFVVSLLCSINVSSIHMIVITIFSGLFLILVIADMILLTMFVY